MYPALKIRDSNEEHYRQQRAVVMGRRKSMGFGNRLQENKAETEEQRLLKTFNCKTRQELVKLARSGLPLDAKMDLRKPSMSFSSYTIRKPPSNVSIVDGEVKADPEMASLPLHHRIQEREAQKASHRRYQVAWEPCRSSKGQKPPPLISTPPRGTVETPSPKTTIIKMSLEDFKKFQAEGKTSIVVKTPTGNQVIHLGNLKLPTPKILAQKPTEEKPKSETSGADNKAKEPSTVEKAKPPEDTLLTGIGSRTEMVKPPVSSDLLSGLCSEDKPAPTTLASSSDVSNDALVEDQKLPEKSACEKPKQSQSSDKPQIGKTDTMETKDECVEKPQRRGYQSDFFADEIENDDDSSPPTLERVDTEPEVPPEEVPVDDSAIPKLARECVVKPTESKTQFVPKLARRLITDSDEEEELLPTEDNSCTTPVFTSLKRKQTDDCSMRIDLDDKSPLQSSGFKKLKPLPHMKSENCNSLVHKVIEKQNILPDKKVKLNQKSKDTLASHDDNSVLTEEGSVSKSNTSSDSLISDPKAESETKSIPCLSVLSTEATSKEHKIPKPIVCTVKDSSRVKKKKSVTFAPSVFSSEESNIQTVTTAVDPVPATPAPNTSATGAADLTPSVSNDVLKTNPCEDKIVIPKAMHVRNLPQVMVRGVQMGLRKPINVDASCASPGSTMYTKKATSKISFNAKVCSPLKAGAQVKTGTRTKIYSPVKLPECKKEFVSTVSPLATKSPNLKSENQQKSKTTEIVTAPLSQDDKSCDQALKLNDTKSEDKAVDVGDNPDDKKTIEQGDLQTDDESETLLQQDIVDGSTTKTLENVSEELTQIKKPEDVSEEFTKIKMIETQTSPDDVLLTNVADDSKTGESDTEVDEKQNKNEFIEPNELVEVDHTKPENQEDTSENPPNSDLSSCDISTKEEIIESDEIPEQTDVCVTEVIINEPEKPMDVLPLEKLNDTVPKEEQEESVGITGEVHEIDNDQLEKAADIPSSMSLENSDDGTNCVSVNLPLEKVAHEINTQDNIENKTPVEAKTENINNTKNLNCEEKSSTDNTLSQTTSILNKPYHKLKEVSVSLVRYPHVDDLTITSGIVKLKSSQGTDSDADLSKEICSGGKKFETLHGDSEAGVSTETAGDKKPIESFHSVSQPDIPSETSMSEKTVESQCNDLEVNVSIEKTFETLHSDKKPVDVSNKTSGCEKTDESFCGVLKADVSINTSSGEKTIESYHGFDQHDAKQCVIDDLSLQEFPVSSRIKNLSEKTDSSAENTTSDLCKDSVVINNSHCDEKSRVFTQNEPNAMDIDDSNASKHINEICNNKEKQESVTLNSGSSSAKNNSNCDKSSPFKRPALPESSNIGIIKKPKLIPDSLKRDFSDKNDNSRTLLPNTFLTPLRDESSDGSKEISAKNERNALADKTSPACTKTSPACTKASPPKEERNVFSAFCSVSKQPECGTAERKCDKSEGKSHFSLPKNFAASLTSKLKNIASHVFQVRSSKIIENVGEILSGV